MPLKVEERAAACLCVGWVAIIYVRIARNARFPARDALVWCCITYGRVLESTRYEQSKILNKSRAFITLRIAPFRSLFHL